MLRKCKSSARTGDHIDLSPDNPHRAGVLEGNLHPAWVVIEGAVNQEEPMTDFRDPNYRDPARPGYRDPDMPAESGSWSGATWGWIAGIALVALVLIFAFSSGRDGDRLARDSNAPPATTGQRSTPPAAPSTGMNPAPSTNPSAPAPAPAAPQQ
jgi:hypothetical protein